MADKSKSAVDRAGVARFDTFLSRKMVQDARSYLGEGRRTQCAFVLLYYGSSYSCSW